MQQIYSNFKTIVAEKLSPIYSPQESHSIASYLAEYYVDKIPRSYDMICYDENKLNSQLQILLLHTPIQYVVGFAWFYNLKFQVNNQVLIPRQETELLVHHIHNSHDNHSNLNIIDLGTGSGCIPIALKSNKNNWKITAIDISADALIIAKTNANNHNADIKFLCANLLEIHTLPASTFDIIISNPPYILKSEAHQLPQNVLDFEPHVAIFCEEDPLLFYKAILDYSLNALAPNGFIYMEINENYAREVTKLFNYYFETELITDLQNKPRIIKAFYKK